MKARHREANECLQDYEASSNSGWFDGEALLCSPATWGLCSPHGRMLAAWSTVLKGGLRGLEHFRGRVPCHFPACSVLVQAPTVFVCEGKEKTIMVVTMVRGLNNVIEEALTIFN